MCPVEPLFLFLSLGAPSDVSVCDLTILRGPRHRSLCTWVSEPRRRDRREAPRRAAFSALEMKKARLAESLVQHWSHPGKRR